MTDPAEKYRDKVDPEHAAAMDMVIAAWHALKVFEPKLQKFSDAERQSHSILHITDPTLYRDSINSKSLAAQVKLARAALAFIKVADEVAAEVVEGKP